MATLHISKVETLHKIYLTSSTSNDTGYRSFSALKSQKLLVINNIPGAFNQFDDLKKKIEIKQQLLNKYIYKIYLNNNNRTIKNRSNDSQFLTEEEQVNSSSRVSTSKERSPVLKFFMQ